MEAKKKPEQLYKERTADNLMNYMITKTFSRHSKMTEEEFLKEIGFEGSGKTEDEAIRIAIFNVLTESMKQFIMAKQSLDISYKTMEMLLKGDK